MGMYTFKIQLFNMTAKEISGIYHKAAKLPKKTLGCNEHADALGRLAVAYALESATQVHERRPGKLYTRDLQVQADHMDQARAIASRLLGMPAYIALPKNVRVI